MHKDKCTASWYVRALIKDINSSDTFHLFFGDAAVKQLLTITKSVPAGEDEIELYQVINITFDFIDKNVSKIFESIVT